LFIFYEHAEQMNFSSILTKAMEATSPPLSWKVCEHEALASPGDADAILALRIKEGPAHRFAVEVKTVVRIETLGAQEARRSKTSRHLNRLLVVPYMSKKNAALFQDAGLNFMDTAGNAFIDVPGCYVFISGKQRLEQEPPGSGHEVMGSASALRVIFTLLTEPDMPGRPIRDIATKAGVSLGSAAKAMEGLRRLGHLSPGDTKSRRLLAADTLRTEWARNYPIALRSKLKPQRYAPQNGWWWKDAKLQPEDAAWGGEVGAALKTSYLQPEQATIYCWKDRGKLLMQYRLRPDPNGTVEILDAFWTPPGSSAEPIAPLLLVYADLMTSLDSRNRDVASLLKKEIFDAETAS
jgi:hypothetical protein